MNVGGKLILIHTCVWVDNYCADHVAGVDAKQFLQMSFTQNAELLYAVHAAKDVLYVLENEFKRAARRELGTIDESVVLSAKKAALGCVRNMCDLATAVGADTSDIWLANKYLRIHPDFEDNLVLAACKRAKADYLVTNDRTLIAHADVTAKTPREMLELMSLDF